MAALLIMWPVAAQDSFLDEFRSVNRLQSHRSETPRPAFLISPDSDTEDPLANPAAADDEDFESNQISAPEPSSRVHSAGLTTDELCAETACDTVSDCDLPLVRFRNGCYQGSQLNYGYVYDDPNTGLAIRTLDTYATFAIPLGSMENVITFTPFFRADMLDAAATLDVPSTLYETGVKAFWRRPVNDRFSTIFLLTPSVRSDFQTSDRAFRLFGLGLLTWQWIPDRLSISGGAMYTGREDYPVLPAMGLLWTPTSDWRFDVQFPSPRISYRLAKNGATSETWAYLAGVFGGNTWAVTRANGTPDMLTLRDLRLVSGVEHQLAGNRGIFGEVGYVFDRSMEYTDVPFMQDFGATWMLRTGISF
jgi:hypothetical protein